MIRLRAVLLVAVFGSACAHGAARVRYVVEGRVVDATTGQPIPGALVHVHWPSRMPGYGAMSGPLGQIRTGPRGRFWVTRLAPQPARYCACGIGRPCSIDPGSAAGTALTIHCPTCKPLSVGVGERTMDVLVRDEAGAVRVVRSVPRPADLVRGNEAGGLLVRTRLPDIVVEPGRVPTAPPPALPPRPLRPAGGDTPPSSDGDGVPTI